MSKAKTNKQEIYAFEFEYEDIDNMNRLYDELYEIIKNKYGHKMWEHDIITVLERMTHQIRLNENHLLTKMMLDDLYGLLPHDEYCKCDENGEVGVA